MQMKKIFVLVRRRWDVIAPEPLAWRKEDRATSSRRARRHLPFSRPTHTRISRRRTSPQLSRPTSTPATMAPASTTAIVSSKAISDDVTARLLQACEILTTEFPRLIARVAALEGQAKLNVMSLQWLMYPMSLQWLMYPARTLLWIARMKPR